MKIEGNLRSKDLLVKLVHYTRLLKKNLKNILYIGIVKSRISKMNALPSYLSKKEVDELAEKAYFALEANTFSLEKIIEEKISGKIEYKPLDELFTSGTLVVNNSKPTIYVNSYEPYQRTRFTLAHELGHFMLHSNFGEKDITIHRSGENERTEWEANWFAAGFLMPRNEFIEEYKKNKDTLYLSNRFNVSTSAITYRIKFLTEVGLITD